MKIFTVRESKRYIIAGGLIGLIVPFILRLFIPAFSLSELSLHIAIRNTLGYPFGFYSYLAIILLTLLYETAYGLLGAFVGYLLFRISHRKQGYTLYLTKGAKQLGGILLLVCTFLFLRVDLMNPIQEKIHPPQLPPTFVAAVKDIFLPSFDFSQKSMSPWIDTSLPSTTTYTPPPNTSSQNTTITNSGNANSQTQTTTTQQTDHYPQYQRPTSIPMASPQALFAQLNVWRQKNGKPSLQWDTKLANYAQSRANYFISRGSMDDHKGFDDYVKRGPGHCELGFYGLGENSSIGESNTAQYMIDVYFGTSAPHNYQQLNAAWSHVGVGVSGNATNFVFGGRQRVNAEHPC